MFSDSIHFENMFAISFYSVQCCEFQNAEILPNILYEA